MNINGEKIDVFAFLQALVRNFSIQPNDLDDLQRMENKTTIFVKDPYHIQMKTYFDHNRLPHYQFIIADNSDGNKKMAVLTADSVDSELVEMDCSGMRENVIIDLNREGRRWEGGELNGKPFGFGREYSEKDNLVYEGFVFEGMKVCFGKEWNNASNNNCLMYEGGYCNNERWGEGKSYNLNGNVVYEGEWMNNHGISENGNDLMNDLIVPISIEEYVIGDEMYNDENIATLHFSPLLTQLKRIKIGNQCFKHVRVFVINGLPNLESVEVGNNCFSISLQKGHNDDLFRIMNCPTLKQLKIGRDSFRGYSSFYFSNVKSLQTLQLAMTSFPNDREVIIHDVFGMKMVDICNNNFFMDWIGQNDIPQCSSSRQLVVKINRHGDVSAFGLSGVKYLKSIVFDEKSFHDADCSLKRK